MNSIFYQASSPDYDGVSPSSTTELEPILGKETSLELIEAFKNKQLPIAEFIPDVNAISRNESMQLDYEQPVNENLQNIKSILCIPILNSYIEY